MDDNLNIHFPDSLIKYSHVQTSVKAPNKVDIDYKNFSIKISKNVLIKSQKTLNELPFNQSITAKSNNQVLSRCCTSEDQTCNLKHEHIDIINQLVPPRKHYNVDKRLFYIQYASLQPATRADMYSLNEKLNFNLQKYNAREIGLCSIRRKFYMECLDEIIRQVSIECVERGILLARLRDEIQQTINTYKLLYTSATAFGMRKVLLNEDKCKCVCEDLERHKVEITELNKQIDELKMKNIQLERKLQEQDKTYEKKFNDEIQTHQKSVNSLKKQIDEFKSLIMPFK